MIPINLENIDAYVCDFSDASQMNEDDDEIEDEEGEEENRATTTNTNFMMIA